MENVDNSFQINVIRPVIFPFIQEEMTLRWMSGETTNISGTEPSLVILSQTKQFQNWKWCP